ncbi:MAG TPA: tetratricopeptide repeat protein [Patescibacteria group bacterium]|jgi:tetratricopeptide (TPR) repeat protein
MFTALILIVLVAGIVYAARRWPDVEARFFGVDKVDVPKSETAEPAAKPHDAGAAESVKEHARNAGRAADRTVHRVTEAAGGLFKKKAISKEPTVEETAKGKDKKDEVFSSKAATGDELDDTTTASDLGPDTADTPTEETPDEDSARPNASGAHAPGERVTSVPARPSEPAYVDATRHQPDSFEQLSAEADQAWRDREYERCEEACLKILVQQPKNIKYMTRIGQVYQQLGQLDDAKEAFEAAKKLDPRNFFVLNRLSEVERLMSDKKGRTQLNKVLKK